MNDNQIEDFSPVTIDSHVHYVASGGKCRPAVVIDTGDGSTLGLLFAFTTPDEGHTIWHPNCEYDANKAIGTWHYAFCEG